MHRTQFCLNCEHADPDGDSTVGKGKCKLSGAEIAYNFCCEDFKLWDRGEPPASLINLDIYRCVEAFDFAVTKGTDIVRWVPFKVGDLVIRLDFEPNYQFQHEGVLIDLPRDRVQLGTQFVPATQGDYGLPVFIDGIPLDDE